MTRYIISAMIGALSAGCMSGSDRVVSSMNFLQAPVDPSCALAALRDEEGFAVLTPYYRDQGAYRIDARFNEDLPVTVLIRRYDDGSAEVSSFSKLPADATPLTERKAGFAIRAADEVIYRQCTADGQIEPGGAAVVIDPQE
ncbi:hypothetical protein PB2503_04492 [Parvularcula bermudensis HTCC2503]|uniref:Lipoprotein n=1 Tax=Parvularcula bermudensis (strain ATCC BAA-594 / HTCC2503 / KCTC 12087) TaxID=314260 RepID=E0TF55_PARBH|nr:hypothetical protein [Parvularcula bermudensis]ADM08973.1 hypothetical protein PB2503_04492 [Parvularcula bermudensis HTCC2503]